jgi:hypothetical protein
MNNPEKKVKEDKFDFDKWSELSKQDPEAFEALRKQSISEFIEGCAESRQERLRCLQWKIDTIRGRHDTPLSACVAISDMMWDSLERLHRVYYEYEGITNQKNGPHVYAPLPKAKVLNFQVQS